MIGKRENSASSFFISRVVSHSLIGFLFLSFYSCLAQEKVLEFSDGTKYELYFVDVAHEPQPVNLTHMSVDWDTTRSFLIDNASTIQALTNAWTGERTEEQYGCWYNYFIYVFENGHVTDVIKVNDECKQVITKKGIYNYANSPIKSLKSRKKLIVADIAFNDLSTGRTFVLNASKVPSIFIPYIEETDWYNFGGELIIETFAGAIEKHENEIRQRLKLDFTNRNFDVRFYHEKDDKAFFEIYCDEDMAQNLKGFSVVRAWEPDKPFHIRLVSSAVLPINDLIAKFENHSSMKSDQ